MKQVPWDQVNALLDAALALPSDERDAYLEAQCKNDSTLLNEVRSLLDAHDNAGSFLETPADEYAATLLSKEGAPMSDPLVGQVVDGYRILDVLGRGGMGVVYKAQNLALNRTEALKVIAPMLVRDAQFLRRFRLEAQALAQIHHPNIVTVYALRESEAGHYITMEFVEGHTLADVLPRHGALPWQDALPIIKQLLQAFEYAHKRGIIHRDIKPRNIMLTSGGVVKVMDFGLAKFYLKNDMTQTHGVSGTPFYMSPEQIRGHANLDQRSDIFSLGMTMYELLSGRLPFDRDDSLFSIQRSIVEETFPSLRHFNASVPEGLANIIMKALEKDPEQRPQFAGDMLKAIEALDKSASHADATIPDTTPDDETITLDPARSPFEKQKPRPPVRKEPAARKVEKQATGKATLPRKAILIGVLLVLGVGLVWGAAPLWRPLFDTSSQDDSAFRETATSEPTDPARHEADPALLDSTLLAENTSLSSPEDTPQDEPQTLPAPQRNRSTTQETEPEAASSSSSSPAINRPANTQTQQEQTPPLSNTTQANDETTSTVPDNAPTPTDTDTPPAEQPEETATGTETTADPVVEEEPPSASPADMVREDARVLSRQLENAITSDSWATMDGSIAAFYQEKLKDLPRKFNVLDANVVIDQSALGAADLDVTLPVTVFLTIQQKGRDGTQAIPIPSNWTWKKVDGRMKLVNVED